MKPIKKISLCGLVSLGLLSSASFLNTNAVTPEKLNPTKIQFAIPSMYKHTFPLEKLGWKPIIVHLDEQPNGDVYAIVPQRSPHNSVITSTQIIHLIGKPIPSSMGGVICNGYRELPPKKILAYIPPVPPTFSNEPIWCHIPQIIDTGTSQTLTYTPIPISLCGEPVPAQHMDVEKLFPPYIGNQKISIPKSSEETNSPKTSEPIDLESTTPCTSSESSATPTPQTSEETNPPKTSEPIDLESTTPCTSSESSATPTPQTSEETNPPKTSEPIDLESTTPWTSSESSATPTQQTPEETNPPKTSESIDLESTTPSDVPATNPSEANWKLVRTESGGEDYEIEFTTEISTCTNSTPQPSNSKFTSDIPQVNGKEDFRPLEALSLEDAKHCKFSKFINSERARKKLCQKFSKKTSDEILKKYTGEPGHYVNKHLKYNGFLRDPNNPKYNNSKEILSDIIILSRSFKKNDKDIKVYRKTWPKAISNLLYEAGIVDGKNWDTKYFVKDKGKKNKYSHDSYRCFVTDNYYIDVEKLINDNKGKIIRDKGFLSTTTDSQYKRIKKFGNIRIEIKLTNAKIRTATDSVQKEVILAPGQKLKLIGAKYDKASNELGIEVEAI